MVGARGFEPPTPGPPDQCANQAALRPVPKTKCQMQKSKYQLKSHADLFQIKKAGINASKGFLSLCSKSLSRIKKGFEEHLPLNPFKQKGLLI